LPLPLWAALALTGGAVGATGGDGSAAFDGAGCRFGAGFSSTLALFFDE
jgi:hypothetical protein